MKDRARLGPGKKSLDRGSTFKSRGDGLKRQPARPLTKAVVEELKANNPPPRRGARGRRNPYERGWTQRVFTLYGRWCVVCSPPGTPRARRKRAVQAHHAVPRRTIEAREGDASPLVFDARNGVPVCRDCHYAHEYTPGKRISFWALPDGVYEWAVDHGFAWLYSRTPKLYPGAPS